MSAMAKKKLKPTQVGPRRYRTDYAGCWAGFCKSRESAIVAAVRHVVNDGYTRATVTDRETGTDIVRIRLSHDRTRAVVQAVEPFREV